MAKLFECWKIPTEFTVMILFLSKCVHVFLHFALKKNPPKYPPKTKTKLFDVAFIVVIHDYGVLSDLFRVICITEMFLKFSMSCGKRAFSDLMFYETCFRLILNGL